MTAWRRTITFGVSFLLFATCTGCSEKEGIPSAPDNASPTKETIADQALPKSPVDAPWKILTKEFAHRVPQEVGVKYTARSNPATGGLKDDEGLTIVRLSDQKIVARYVRSNPKNLVYQVLFWQDTAIIHEVVDNSIGPGLSTPTRYDLISGKRSVMRPSNGHQLGRNSIATIVGDELIAAVNKVGEETTCLHSFNLLTGDEHDTGCLPASDESIFQVRNDNIGISYLTHKGNDISHRRALYYLPAPTIPDAVPSRLGTNTGREWDHAKIDGWEVWSTIPDDENKRNNHMFGELKARQGTQSITLGVSESTTLVHCGKHVYWREQEHQSNGYVEKVVRWKPGNKSVEVVFIQENNGEDPNPWSLYYPSCTQGNLIVSRARLGSAQEREVRYLPDA